MEVKIYRELENENLILDESQLTEYNAIALELGLTTQEKKEDNLTPILYPFLNTAMLKQLKAVCPTSTKAENYTKSTIPLEVLQVYKYCKDNKMFDGFSVWYNDVNPDPLLIGWKWQNENAKEKDYKWQTDMYLIARWGDCALEMTDLLQLGFNNIKKELVNKAKLAIDKCTSLVNNPDMYVDKILSNNDSDMRIDLNVDSSNTIYPF